MMTRKTFTMIELLVVIAVIGILAGLAFPNFMAARERARDSQRKSDLKQIQKALEMYRQDQSIPSYPSSLPQAGAEFIYNNVSYMKKIPGDPLPGRQYFYSVNNSELRYILCACLENVSDNEGVNCISPCNCPANAKCYILNEP